MNQRFDTILDEIVHEATRSIEKHGEQRHLPMGTGADTLPLDTYEGLPHPYDPDERYPRGLRPVIEARHLANMATLDTKAHSHNEGGDGTVTWWHILREEVFEAAAEGDPAKLRAELVQVATVAVKMIDALDHPTEPDFEECGACRRGEHEDCTGAPGDWCRCPCTGPEHRSKP